MKGALRLLYPPQCVSCGAPVAGGGDDPGQLCPDCFPDTRFITGAACGRCGVPLPDDGTGADDPTLTCDDCLTMARPWQAGRAAMVYSGIGRKLVLALKHGDRPDLAPALAAWLARAAAPLVRPDTIVAPVPLHLRRLLKRRYNQAALISGRVARTRMGRHICPACWSGGGIRPDRIIGASATASPISPARLRSIRAMRRPWRGGRCC